MEVSTVKNRSEQITTNYELISMSDISKLKMTMIEILEIIVDLRNVHIFPHNYVVYVGRVIIITSLDELVHIILSYKVKITNNLGFSCSLSLSYVFFERQG